MHNAQNKIILQGNLQNGSYHYTTTTISYYTRPPNYLVHSSFDLVAFVRKRINYVSCSSKEKEILLASLFIFIHKHNHAQLNKPASRTHRPLAIFVDGIIPDDFFFVKATVNIAYAADNSNVHFVL